MKINSNIAALYANRSLERNNFRADKAMMRLSSGSRLNSVKDDAAGTAIATKIRSQIKALNMSNRNSMDGISLAQTAEGALGEIQDMLKRMRELSVQSANGTYESGDREKIAKEIESLTEEISSISERTEYNKTNLLNRGTNAANPEEQTLKLQIGGSEGMILSIKLQKINSDTLGINGASALVRDGDPSVIDTYDNAIEKVASFRSEMGAYFNRLEHTSASLDTSSVNAAQSLSRVADTDMAIEMSEYTKANVIAQAATAMLAQANTRPEQMLQLLR